MGSELRWIIITLNILSIILLVMINALVCMAEISIISINKNKLIGITKEENNKVKRILKLHDNKEEFLYSFQIFMTISILLISFISFNIISKEIKFNFLGVFISIVIIAYLFVVLGYILPKRYSLRNSEKVALKYINFITVIVILLRPFSKLVAVTVNSFISMKKDEKNFLEEEVITLVNNEDLFGNNEKNDNEELFEDKKVEKVMTPRTQVYCIDINEPLEEYLDEMLEQRFSRIPIYEDNIDNIIGVLYIKDFYIEAKNKGFNNLNIREIMMEPYFIPEVNRVKDVFYDLQKTKRQMAIIIDEYGGFSGIVTIEDLVEEIMGEIEDEYHESDTTIEKIEEGTYIVSGVVTLEEINEKLNINLQSTEIDTISGYLINIIGKIPVEEEEKILKEDNVIFKIKEVNEKTIEKVIISILEKTNNK